MTGRNDPCPCGSGRKFKRCCSQSGRRQFTQLQPKDGDVILHCGHPDTAPVHWSRVEPPVRFQRPDGSTGESNWIAACEECWAASGRHAMNVGVRGDGIWTGDEPVITTPTDPTVN